MKCKECGSKVFEVSKTSLVQIEVEPCGNWKEIEEVWEPEFDECSTPQCAECGEMYEGDE